MKQLRTNFIDSKDVKMQDLLFYNPADSADLRQQEATILADELDTVFRKGGFGAVFEDGIKRGKAITTMVGILTDPTKTVADLATNVDDIYIFWQEKTITS